MSIYEITYEDRNVDYLPPDKRLPKWIAWVQVLAAPLQWLRDLCFVDYSGGTTYTAWSNVATYTYGDIVSYSVNNKVGNYLLISPIPTLGIVPTNKASWLKIQDDFVGADERILYTNGKLMVEYILNRYLQTTFRQPPATSDVYITDATGLAYFTSVAYIAGNTYAKYAVISYSGGYYISLQNSNTTHQPDISPTWWARINSIFPPYDAARTFTPTTIIQKGSMLFIALATTVGNAPPNTPTSNANWKFLTILTRYSATTAYTVGDVAYFNGRIYMNILASTGNAPSGTSSPNTWWIVCSGNISAQKPGFAINIPIAVYNALGSAGARPNPADVTINELAKKYTAGSMFEILTY